MKISEMYDASAKAQAALRNIDVAIAMAENGSASEAAYRIGVADAALHCLADRFGYSLVSQVPAPSSTTGEAA